MINGAELLSDLKKIKNKAEFIETTYPNNELWSTVNRELENLISLIKKDMKIFGYG